MKIYNVRPKLAFILFVVPTMASTIFSYEFWPFSNYPMYSVKTPVGEVKALHLYGINQNDEEVRLNSPNQMFPLQRPYLTSKVQPLVKSHEDEKIDKILDFYLSNNSVENFKKMQLREDTFLIEEDYKITQKNSKVLREVAR